MLLHLINYSSLQFIHTYLHPSHVALRNILDHGRVKNSNPLTAGWRVRDTQKIYFRLHSADTKAPEWPQPAKIRRPVRDVVIWILLSHNIALSHLHCRRITPARTRVLCMQIRSTKVWSAQDCSLQCVYNKSNALLSVDVKYEMIKLDRRSVTRSINFGRKVGDNVEHLKRTTPFLIFIGSKKLVGTCATKHPRANEWMKNTHLDIAANVHANFSFLMTHQATLTVDPNIVKFRTSMRHASTYKN